MGLPPQKAPQGGLSDFIHPAHARRCNQHPMAPGEIIPLSQGFAGHTDRFVIVAAQELRIRDNSAIDRGKRIARTESECLPSSQVAFFPASAISQRNTIIASGWGKTGIEPDG